VHGMLCGRTLLFWEAWVGAWHLGVAMSRMPAATTVPAVLLLHMGTCMVGDWCMHWQAYLVFLG
jgi:hypothetical protein